MALEGTRTFVGIGFGAIQAGLFLYEAYQSDQFRRLVVAEVIPEVVHALRQSGGHYGCNIAHPDRIEPVTIGPVEAYNPESPLDRKRLQAAIIEADEIATAVPSIRTYSHGTESSLDHWLAAGLRRKLLRGGPPAVIYAAENHNHAAEILRGKITKRLLPEEVEKLDTQVRFLNTVIGKMSGVVNEPDKIKAAKLRPIKPGLERAFLVEAFNRILISQIDFPPNIQFERGIQIFEEKFDLLPFEEAKLYGHNATHALGAYLGKFCEVETYAALAHLPGILPFLEAAFLDESGTALIRKHRGVDPLFTPKGYADYARDLLARMTNPFLHDTITRVARSPARKLGWDDRLIGTIRLAQAQGILAERYALGAAAALVDLQPSLLIQPDIQSLTASLWGSAHPNSQEEAQMQTLLATSLERLQAWHAAGFPNLDTWFSQSDRV